MTSAPQRGRLLHCDFCVPTSGVEPELPVAAATDSEQELSGTTSTGDKNSGLNPGPLPITQRAVLQ
jgi:hypothetical protein